jgi:hypothetical protein
MIPGLEWQDTNLQSELRWGMRKGPRSPLANSMRIASIVREHVDAGKDTLALKQVFVINMSTLFVTGHTKAQSTFESLDDAKQEVLGRVHTMLVQVSVLATDAMFAPVKENA